MKSKETVMSVRSILAAIFACALAASTLNAQPRQAAPAAPTAPERSVPVARPAPAPRPKGQPVNIKVDVTVIDQRSSTLPEPVRKTISIVTADGLSGQVRSSSSYSGTGGLIPLNVDVEPTIVNGKIQTHLSLAYDMPAARTTEPSTLATGTLTRTAIQDNLWLILEDGKSITIAQSADPVTDRQVVVEVKATILK
jgi:hypothetical protein